MNIYRCVSETLCSRQYWDEPGEDYCIAVLVAAETPAQARWDAWRTDRYSFDSSCMIDMPKFSVVRTRKDVAMPRGVIDSPHTAWWDTPSQIRAWWRERKVKPKE